MKYLYSTHYAVIYFFSDLLCSMQIISYLSYFLSKFSDALLFFTCATYGCLLVGVDGAGYVFSNIVAHDIHCKYITLKI